MEPQEFTVAVRDVRDVGGDTVAVEFETPDGFEAYPGQFVLVRATVDGEEVARHYTFSSPGVEETYEITVGVDPEGDLSPWLADRRPGDELTVEGPFGTVFYDEGGDVVCIAGGPGIGPALAIAERARRDGRAAAVVYEDDDPAHEERLSALAGEGASVTIVRVDGGLDEAVTGHVDDGQHYVFGFQSFVERARDAIAAAGGDPEAAEFESFG